VKDLLLLLPRLARMVAALLADRAVPRGAKLALAALAVYLASPVDLLPDFIPLLGYVDDILLAAVVLDALFSAIDREVLLRVWPADPAKLDTVAATARRLSAWVPRRIKDRIAGRRAA
jgi:uncharacterized membrane protein YkvA (DUF1232 family)